MTINRNPGSKKNGTFQKLWEHSPAGCLVVDTGGSVTAVNRTAQRLFGTSAPAILNRTLPELVDTEDKAMVEGMLTRTVETGISEKQEIRLLKPSGVPLVCLLELQHLGETSGQDRIQAVLTDITEQKQAEADLKKSAQEKNAILDSLLEHVVYQDQEMKILWANKAACDSVQMTRKDLLGRHCYEVWSNRQSPCEDCPVTAARETQQRQIVEKMTPDGRWWHIQSVPVRDDSGHITGTAEITLDITQRKLAEEALRKARDDLEIRVRERTVALAEANQKLKQEIEDRKKTEADLLCKEIDLRESEAFSTSLLTQAPNPILVFNPDSSIKYVNPALEKLTGFPAAELIGKKSPYPWWLAESLDATRLEFEQAMENGLNRFEKCFQAKNGGPFWVAITFNKIQSNGELKYYLANWVDITERKQAEAALRNSEATTRALLNAPGDLVLLVDARGVLIEANAAVGRSFKKSPASLPGMTIWDLFAPEVARRRKSYVDQVVRSGKAVQFEDERDGIWWDSIVYPVQDDDGAVTRVAVVARDVTLRKSADEMLRASEERYRSVVDNIAIGIALISSEMEILTLNHQMKKWFPHIDPARKPLCYRSFFRRPRQGVCPSCPTIQSLRDGAVHESIIEKSKGDDVRYYRLVASPVKDFKGKIVASTMMIEDISARRRAERQIQNLSHRLLHAQEAERRMISNELHDSVAQDLSTIKIALETLFTRQAARSPDTRQKVSKLAKIINQSIATVRNLSYDLRPPGLSEIELPQVLSTYCEEFAEDHGLALDFNSAGFKKARMDPFVEINLYRLVQEGLNNVRKHAHAGRIAVKLLRAAPHIILRIEDDGKGFDVRARESALDGEKRLGLRSMEDRVKLLQGEIRITSKLGKGTKIFIKIPCRESRIEP